MHDESATYYCEHVLLRIRGDELMIVASTRDGPDQHFSSSVSQTRILLEQEPLTEAKLESAIAQIEDRIMPIIRALPAHTELKISGFELERILELLPETNSSSVPIESVEALFNQLADYAGGVPFAWHHSLSPMQAALGLVSLREVMHHGGYSFVSVLEDAG